MNNSSRLVKICYDDEKYDVNYELYVYEKDILFDKIKHD